MTDVDFKVADNLIHMEDNSSHYDAWNDEEDIFAEKELVSAYHRWKFKLYNLKIYSKNFFNKILITNHFYYWI